MSGSWDEEFHPSAGTRGALRWAHEHGASSLGEAHDLLDQLEVSNDVPEVLGHDDTVDDVRAEVQDGLDVLGPDADLTDLL